MDSKGLGHRPSVSYTSETAGQASAVGLPAKRQKHVGVHGEYLARLVRPSDPLRDTTPPFAAGLPHYILVPT
jgi:hypothetical protein